MNAGTLCLLVSALLVCATPGAASTPSVLPFQGIITNAAGEPIASGTAVTFSLRDAAGTALWSAIYVVTPVDGVVSLMLGANDGGGQAPVPVSAFIDGGERFLAVTVAGQELSAIRLGSAAYAFHAFTADVASQANGVGPDAVGSAEIQDGAVTAAKILDGAVTAADILPALVSSLEGVTNDGGNIDLVAGTNVTISADDAANTITIAATGGGGGVTGSGGAGYLPRFTGPTAIGNSALYQSGSALGLGTTAPDRLLVVESAAGDAILGEVSATGQTDYIGVEGIAVPSEDYGVGGQFLGGYLGVWARSDGTSAGDYYGVYGQATGGAGGFAYGTAGDAHGTEVNVGILGYAEGGTSNYAGYFLGDVQVDGVVTSAGFAARIDHPLAPATMTLSQALVESAEMMSIYGGSVLLDGAGSAWVELPTWCEALNRDFRYQLTCVGGFAPVYVASELASGRFQIAGGTPGLKVCWQLTGIRQDAWAAQHPLTPEALKPAAEAGRYLHPAAAGQPASRGLLPPPAPRLRGR